MKGPRSVANWTTPNTKSLIRRKNSIKSFQNLNFNYQILAGNKKKILKHFLKLGLRSPNMYPYQITLKVLDHWFSSHFFQVRQTLWVYSISSIYHQNVILQDPVLIDSPYDKRYKRAWRNSLGYLQSISEIKCWLLYK